MKELKLYPHESFIGSYKIDSNICDKLIEYYKNNSHLHMRGVGGFGDDVSKKDAYDLTIKYNDFHYPIKSYRDELQKCLFAYNKNYPASIDCRKFNVSENYHIQYYKPEGGYKIWHNERGGITVANRHLVFMTYLNDVEEGGTEFLHQKIKTKCEKGVTLIWPTDWTHQHKGVISEKQEKYIITGWWSFIE